MRDATHVVGAMTKHGRVSGRGYLAKFSPSLAKQIDAVFRREAVVTTCQVPRPCLSLSGQLPRFVRMVEA